MLEIAQEWMALRVWLSEEGAGATVHKAVSGRHYRQQRGYAPESDGLLSREEPISRSVDSTDACWVLPCWSAGKKVLRQRAWKSVLIGKRETPKQGEQPAVVAKG